VLNTRNRIMHFQRRFRKPVGANLVSLAPTLISRDGDDYGNLRSGIYPAISLRQSL